MVNKTESKTNMGLHKKEGYVLISINPRIYPLDVIYSAAYVFLDKAYILLGGNPKEEIVVELRPKEEYNLEKLGREFNNELLNYAFYKKQAEKNAPIRQAIMQRALLTSELSDEIQPETPQPQQTPDFKAADADWLKDPQGISIPWEEKYGRKRVLKAKRGQKNDCD